MTCHLRGGPQLSRADIPWLVPLQVGGEVPMGSRQWDRYPGTLHLLPEGIQGLG